MNEWILPPHRSVRVTSCCTRRSSSCSSSFLRQSTLSWMSWSRCVCVNAVSCSFQQKWVCCNCATHQLTVLFPPQLELKKTLLDRMVHLLSRGYVLPVVGYIRKCLEKLNTDISLIRYFVTEVTAASYVDFWQRYTMWERKWPQSETLQGVCRSRLSQIHLPSLPWTKYSTCFDLLTNLLLKQLWLAFL